MGQDNPIQRQKVSVPDIVIITGMSGSGRTQALHVFEDMGYYCIDNLPPTLILQLANVVGINSSIGRHLAVTCDLRSQGLFDDMLEVLHSLADHELTYSMVFLDSSDEVIMRRYDENRRRHPVAQQGESLEKAVKRERRQLAVVRKAADVVIDTSTMRTTTLRNRLRRIFSELSDQQLLEVNVFSFGFKHGMPVESDLMIDVRFLPNPFYDPEMRTMTGLDERVAAYVLDNPTTKKFLKSLCPAMWQRESHISPLRLVVREGSIEAWPLQRQRASTFCRRVIVLHFHTVILRLQTRRPKGNREGLCHLPLR